jgi:3-methyl-2-oxobutanoate hydroxymethyltransferase
MPAASRTRGNSPCSGRHSSAACDEIKQQIDIPAIGIGASPPSAGQILVMESMLSLNDRVPRFAERCGDLASDKDTAILAYA